MNFCRRAGKITGGIIGATLKGAAFTLGAWLMLRFLGVIA